jgi:DNA-binding beta-propeller fold protein YncE
MSVRIQIKRGTRAEIDTAAGASGLHQGEPYLITDEDRLAVGTGTGTYEAMAKESEAGGGLATANLTGATQTVDFSVGDIFTSTLSQQTTDFVFSNPDTVDRATIIIEHAWDDGWNFGVAAYEGVSFDVSEQESTPNDVVFGDDGAKMYVLGATSDSVHQYDLTVKWDLSTARFVQSFSVSSQEISPEGLAFKADGTAMYVTGTSGDDVNEYSLSTAWDVSSASYVRNFSVSGQTASPKGLFFKSDGTKMYVAGGGSTQEIIEYDLSTAWNVSTASYVRDLDVGSQEDNLGEVHFKPDGTEMFIVGGDDEVNKYTLGTAWNISTATHDSAFDISGQATNPTGIFINPDGTAFFVTGSTTDAVFQYSLARSPTINFPAALEAPVILPPTYQRKAAFEIVTTDGGTSYQLVSRGPDIG